MKHTRECARNLAALLKKRRKLRTPPPPEADDPIAVFVLSFLMWDSTTAKATAAYKRITGRVVDFNDLRVSLPDEIVELIGPRYPAALQRCQRLRAVLRHMYKREHAMSLQRLHSLGKREIKMYLRSLDGIVPYVADRVMLLCFETHCIPVDERLHGALVKVGACDESAEIAELASWLARQVKAADALATHYTLQAWVDRAGATVSAPPAAKSSPRRSTPHTGRRTRTATRKRTAKSRTR